MPFVLAIIGLAYPIIYKYYMYDYSVGRLTAGFSILFGYTGLVIGGYYLGMVGFISGFSIYFCSRN